MPHRHDRPHNHLHRALIASAAARLIAEEGINDFAFAKRKAARSLGLPETGQMPDNAEIEAELRIHQRLFQDVEQQARVAHLRRKAAELMKIMAQFKPYLSGSVLDGTAGRYAEIDIQLFADSAKDVEIFLLNRQIDFEHSIPRSERAEAVLTIHADDTIANLVVYPPNEERMVHKTRDGRVRQRARLDVVKGLLATNALTDHA